jgi:maleylacetate reductase
MRPFVYNALPARVVFGHGTISQVADEVGRLGCRRALILSTLQQQSDAERLASHLGDFAAGVFAGAVIPNLPIGDPTCACPLFPPPT